MLARLGAEHAQIEMKPGRDLDWHEAGRAAPIRPAAESPKSSTPSTRCSSSTPPARPESPRACCTRRAGYLAGAHVTTKYVFDLRDDDVYWCTADVGWVTGHSYIVYGPLSNGATCVMYEGAPNQPDWGRFWNIIEKHKVTILYTAPTAIRAFIRQGDEWPAQGRPFELAPARHRRRADQSRGLGLVLRADRSQALPDRRHLVADRDRRDHDDHAARRALDEAGRRRACRSSASKPDVVTKDGKSVGANQGGLLVLRRPWPSMLRTVWGDDERYRKQYLSEIPGAYFTGDGARRDEDGYFHVVGRIDDVLNVAGHRIGTAEIESALVSHPAVAEAAAVGRPDELKGQALVVFVTLKPGFEPGRRDEEAPRRARRRTRSASSPARTTCASPTGCPRRAAARSCAGLLKDIAAGRETQGDISTLEDLNVLAKLRQDEE